jgi:hypothetical protein
MKVNFIHLVGREICPVSPIGYSQCGKLREINFSLHVFTLQAVLDNELNLSAKTLLHIEVSGQLHSLRTEIIGLNRQEAWNALVFLPLMVKGKFPDSCKNLLPVVWPIASYFAGLGVLVPLYDK